MITSSGLLCPNFEEVEGHIGLGLCVCASVCYAYHIVRDRVLKFYMWNKYENKRTFFFSVGLVVAELRPFFRNFVDFPIVSLWNLVNRISRESLELDS